MQQTISVWVRDPRIQKNDFWHAYIYYEICLHTDSVCFTKKISSVRRRYSEFVWLRQKLEANSLLMIKLPDLPPKNPFFSLNNARQITERMKGLQRFLEQILQSPLLLSDSCLHLFLQSQLSVSKMEACAAGRTRYSVEQAVQGCGLRRFHSHDDLHGDPSSCCDCDSDSSECVQTEPVLLNKSPSTDLLQDSGVDQEDTLKYTSEATWTSPNYWHFGLVTPFCTFDQILFIFVAVVKVVCTIYCIMMTYSCDYLFCNSLHHLTWFLHLNFYFIVLSMLK